MIDTNDPRARKSMAEAQRSDSGLYDAVRETGDEAALAALLERNWNAAYHIALSFVREASAAEDVAQEACLKLIEAADRGRRVDNFPAWFRIVVANEARVHLRSQKRRQRREETMARPNRIAADQGSALRELTEALPQKLRQPLELHFGLGLTHAEVAQTLDCPKGTVSTWIREGLSRLKKSFEAQGVTLSLAAVSELAGASLSEACAAQGPPCPSVASLRGLARGSALAGGSAAGLYAFLATAAVVAALAVGVKALSPEAEPRPAPAPAVARGEPGPGGRAESRAGRTEKETLREIGEAEGKPAPKQAAEGAAVKAEEASGAPRSGGGLVEERARRGGSVSEAVFREGLSHKGLARLFPGPDARSLFSFGDGGGVLGRGAIIDGESVLGGEIRLWDLETGGDRTFAARQPGGADCNFDRLLVFDEGRKLAASGRNSGALRGELPGAGEGRVFVWDTRSGEVLTRAAWPSGSFAPFHPSLPGAIGGEAVLVHRPFDQPQLLDLATGTYRAVGTGFCTTHVAVSPDGRRMVSYEFPHRSSDLATHKLEGSHGEGALVVWDLIRGSLEHRIAVEELGNEAGGIGLFAFDEGGSRLITAGGRALRRWDLVSGRELSPAKILALGPELSIVDLIRAPELGALIVSASDGGIRVLDAEDLSLRRTLQGLSGEAVPLALLGDGRTLASGDREDRVRFWDLEAREAAAPKARGHTGPVLRLVFAPDGKRLASVGQDPSLSVANGACLWDASGELERFFPDIADAGFDGAGVLVLRETSSFNLQFRFRRVDVKSGEPLGEVMTRLPEALPNASSIARSGRRAAVGGARLACVVDLETGAPLFKAIEGGEELWSVALSPKGGLLAARPLGAARSIRLFDLAIGRELGRFLWPEERTLGPGQLFVHEEAAVLIGASLWKTCAWSIASGRSLWTEDGFRALALSGDGGLVAGTRSQDSACLVELRAAKSGALIASFPWSRSRPTALAFSPDNKRLALGLDDGRVLVLDREG